MDSQFAVHSTVRVEPSRRAWARWRGVAQRADVVIFGSGRGSTGAPRLPLPADGTVPSLSGGPLPVARAPSSQSWLSLVPPGSRCAQTPKSPIPIPPYARADLASGEMAGISGTPIFRDRENPGVGGNGEFSENRESPAVWQRRRLGQGTEPRSPSPLPSPICRGSGMAVPSPICRGSGVHPRRHPRFAGDRGSIPTAIPDLPESGIQLSTIEYCKGIEFRLPQCLTLRLIVLPKLINLRRPAMSGDDAVDYSGTHQRLGQ